MSDDLIDFRIVAAGNRFRLGDWDCGLICADWIMIRRGIDPAAGWRGRYSTRFGLARMLSRRGGIVAHFDACLAAVGIKRTGKPRRGDIAVVETPQGLTGGIVTGPLVLLASDKRGTIERSLKYAPIVAAWRV